MPLSMAQQSQGALSSPEASQYSAFSSMSGSRPPSQTVTPTPSLSQQQQHLQQPAARPLQPAVDPFASISSIGQRQSSPFQPVQPQSNQSMPSSMMQATNPPGSSQAPPTGGASADADEWTFASSLPESSNEIIVTTSTVNIVLAVTRPPGTDVGLSLLAKFSNTSASPVSDLTFQVAVTKVSLYTSMQIEARLTTVKGFLLRLKPQSGRILLPHQRNGITQDLFLEGVERGKGGTVKMRWKVSYKVGSESKEQQGEIASLGDV